jgi:hypothetical protein
LLSERDEKRSFEAAMQDKPAVLLIPAAINRLSTFIPGLSSADGNPGVAWAAPLALSPRR